MILAVSAAFLEQLKVILVRIILTKESLSTKSLFFIRERVNKILNSLKLYLLLLLIRLNLS